MIPKREPLNHGFFSFVVTVSKSILILISLLSSNHCNATPLLILHNITQSQPLSHPNTLVSPGNTFELGFFTPSNRSSCRFVGVWYRGVHPRTVVWLANRETPLNLSDSRASLAIAADGSLEILDGNNRSVWSSESPSRSNTVAMLLESGNLVVFDALTGVQRWQSFDHPGDSFLPGSRLGFNLKSGESFSLRSWRSESDPSPGGFAVEILRERPPEVVIRSMENGELRWRSGPWDKTKYTGVPEMETYYECQYGLVEDVEKGTTYMTFTPATIIRYFYVSPRGIIRLMEKNATEDEFRLNWEIPTNVCDLYGACGPYGVCRNYTTPMCECLKGFEPRSGHEWRAGNWTGGCVRKNELACDRSNRSRSLEEDGFMVIRDVKPPDFYEFVELGYPSADHCQRVCLRNCSCLAYAHVEGIGCVVWSRGLIDIQGFSYGGEKIFYRVSREELDGLRRMEIMVSIVAVFAALAIFGTAVLILHKRRVKQSGRENDLGEIWETTKLFEMGEPSESMRQSLQFFKQNNPTELPTFEFGAIMVATNHFSPTNKLGQGGFGSVYKGVMSDGKRIAVKRLASSSGQGIMEFENEMILISRLQHRNLVRLLGYCIENEEKLLVYEYMPNNSLDHFIFDSERSAKLNWGTRMNIILGVSRGLAYLHRDSCLRVVHRDLKASNILLDEKMNPKISDFGLARMFQGTMDLTNTQRVVGTLGYMSPEYAIAGVFSEKSDVFSFGVLLLEILSGTKNTSFYDYEDQLTLIPYAWKLWSEDKGGDLVDKALDGLYSAAEAMRCLHVALLCVQDNAVDRPTMTDVVFMLSNDTDRPNPKHPLFSFNISRGCENKKSSDSNNNNNNTLSNELTTSLVLGR